MRIERIRSGNLVGLENVDWIFPTGPILLLFKDKSHLMLFRDLLLTLFYDQPESLLLTKLSRKGLVEVWLSEENFHFYIRHEFIQKDDKLERISTLMNDGQILCLPETMTLGEYLFKVQLQVFRQGGTVDWPETDCQDYLFRRVRNLCQGGDEGLSLTKVRASIAGAYKKVKEQKESMALVKAEYDALRHEWEMANRQLDYERLLQIDIKKLQEKETMLTERITLTANIQKRIELLSQNPDYRELRRLQEELNSLEERWRSLEENLTAISYELHVDWKVIESLREECLEWACLQKNVGCLVTEAQMRSKQIAEIQDFLQTSGYHGLSEDEDQLLKQALEEREGAQEKLNKLLITKRGLNKLQIMVSKESALLKDFEVMADVTEADEIRIAQKEKHLELWRSSKVASILDRTLRKRLGLISIAEVLSSRLFKFYKQYHASNYLEFKSQLKQFLDQRKRVESLKRQMERLQEKVKQEEKLRKTVYLRNKIIKQAFIMVHAADFSEWRNGWEDFRRKKHQLSLQLDELHLVIEQQTIEEKNLEECAERLRKKLENWGIPITDREEALMEVLKVANKLRERDEVEREVAVLSERFHGLLGDRNLEPLSKALEPLAELEREKRIPNEERLAEISAWNKEQTEICQHLAVANQRLQNNQKYPSLSVLEKKIEPMKRQWMAYEDLCHALDDAQALLELSWHEWQRKHEKILNDEKQWIFNYSFSSSTKDSIEGEVLAKMNYFAYRMAIAQLTIGDTIEVPLFFSVGKEKNENQNFWGEVTEYLRKLSLSRQVIFSTTDYKLGEKLSGRGWSLLGLGGKANLN